MGRDLGPVLADILDAVEVVEQATAGKQFADFQRDRLLAFGVQRAIEIISEAVRHLPDDLLARHPAIPWASIRGAGNVLRHEYHRVSDDVIWAVVTTQLAPLKAAVRAMQQGVTG